MLHISREQPACVKVTLGVLIWSVLSRARESKVSKVPLHLVNEDVARTCLRMPVVSPVRSA